MNRCKNNPLNNFNTLLLLCGSKQERKELLRDFIIAHHPDRFPHEYYQEKTNLILEATDLLNKAPVHYGPGRPRKKNTSAVFFKRPLAWDFFCRCEAFVHYNKALSYQHNKSKQQYELQTAKDVCRKFFSEHTDSKYFSEILDLNRQIERLAHLQCVSV